MRSRRIWAIKGYIISWMGLHFPWILIASLKVAMEQMILSRKGPRLLQQMPVASLESSIIKLEKNLKTQYSQSPIKGSWVSFTTLWYHLIPLSWCHGQVRVWVAIEVSVGVAVSHQSWLRWQTGLQLWAIFIFISTFFTFRQLSWLFFSQIEWVSLLFQPFCPSTQCLSSIIPNLTKTLFKVTNKFTRGLAATMCVWLGGALLCNCLSPLRWFGPSQLPTLNLRAFFWEQWVGNVSPSF
jgi:hypothetical protein